MGNFITRRLRLCGHALAALALFMASAGAVVADVAVLPPAKDNTLIESSSGSLSNGAGPAFFVGRTNQFTGSIRRGVIAFDVCGAIPQGATITSAALTLSLSPSNSGSALVSLHRLLEEWGEGASAASGGSGAAAAIGDATWRHTFYDTRFWTHPGGDFDPVAHASASVEGSGFYAWGSTPEMVADVQSWLDAPAGNHGWVLIGGEEFPGTVKRFDSRESEDLEQMPALQIEFTPKCVPDPAGAGYWHRQCLGVEAEAGGIEPGRRGLGPGAPAEPGFEGRVMPCADRMLADLGFASTTSCGGMEMEPPGDCRALALRDLTSLIFNLCSQRLQTSCPVDLSGQGCASGNVGKLIEEVASLLLGGQCREAVRCTALHAPAP